MFTTLHGVRAWSRASVWLYIVQRRGGLIPPMLITVFPRSIPSPIDLHRTISLRNEALYK